MEDILIDIPAITSDEFINKLEELFRIKQAVEQAA